MFVVEMNFLNADSHFDHYRIPKCWFPFWPLPVPETDLYQTLELEMKQAVANAQDTNMLLWGWTTNKVSQQFLITVSELPHDHQPKEIRKTFLADGGLRTTIGLVLAVGLACSKA